MAVEGCADYATTNPDISGVGVRVSFYLQTFLLVILVDRSWEDAPIGLWTFIATSFGITIAALAEHSREELTFFQALEVVNLVWLANLGTFVALGSYSRQRAASRRGRKRRFRPDYGVKFGALFQTLFSMILTLCFWAKADSFGPKELQQCSHLVNYVIFVVRVPALTTGRILSLTLASLLTLCYLLATARELYSFYLTKKLKRESKSSSNQSTPLPKSNKDPLSPLPTFHESPSPKRMPSFSPTLAVNGGVTRITLPHSASRSSSLPLRRLTRSEGSSQTIFSPSEPPQEPLFRPRRREWFSDIDPMLVGIVICQTMIFTYFIASSELLLKYNNAQGNEEIGFGQILALIIVLPSFLSVAGALKEQGLKRQANHKRRRRRQERRPRNDADAKAGQIVPLSPV